MASRSGASVLAAGARRCTAPSSSSASRVGPAPTCRSFSTTPELMKTTRARAKMYKWIESGGRHYEDSTIAKGPNYLGHELSQPFPLNPLFKSEKVLGESMRNEIVDRVERRKQPMKVVSAELGVDVRRIAAVLRLKAIEQQWVQEGKKLMKPYANAMMRMLPVAEYEPGQSSPFEPIHEMHVHKLTMQQLYVPVAESREFTREDAAKAFHRSMLSPDKRSPHPELIKLEKARLEGSDVRESWKGFLDEARAQEDAIVAKETEKRAEAERRTERVDTDRFQFRFKDVNIDVAGKTGRGRHAIGMRYGVPFNDRRKGAVKIPTSVG